MVVRHRQDTFDRVTYMIHPLMEQWREWGVAVEVSHDIRAATGRDTLVIPHLDCTRTPRAYQRYFAACATVVNRSVTDISKRHISKNLVSKPGDYEGPVMVKTDRNYHGHPELDLFKDSGRVTEAIVRIAQRLPWRFTGILDRYRIYDHASLVPRAVWHNPLLVVERFLPEMRDGMYCLRQHIFVGKSEINTLALSADPIVKAANIFKREVLDSAAPGLREMRSALGFDYGKFDYVLHDGEVVLFDANRTPSYNPASAAGSVKPLIVKLAEGIHSFFSEK